MKDYPSIPRCTPTNKDFVDIGNAYVFDKLDGRNVRVEWARKSGWCKFGSRHRLFDASDAEYSPVIPLFESTLAEPLAKLARDERWERVTVFMEYWSQNSLAGVLVPGEVMNLTLFGVAPHKKCLIGPKEFLKTFEGKVAIPKFLGQHHWTRGFVQQVRDGAIEGITFEGVVGSSGESHKLAFAKAKTQAWVDAVIGRYGEEQGRKLVES